jgi:hypothetical protein
VEQFGRAVRCVSAWPSSTGTPSSNRGGGSHPVARSTPVGPRPRAGRTRSRRPTSGSSGRSVGSSTTPGRGGGERKRLTRDRGAELSVTDRER